MAGITEFSLEGEAEFVRVNDENRVKIGGEYVEQIIARQFDFPSMDEWDQMLRRLDQLRQQKLAPAPGEPDVVRAVNLKIEAELMS